MNNSISFLKQRKEEPANYSLNIFGRFLWFVSGAHLPLSQLNYKNVILTLQGHTLYNSLGKYLIGAGFSFDFKWSFREAKT